MIGDATKGTSSNITGFSRSHVLCCRNKASELDGPESDVLGGDGLPREREDGLTIPASK